MFGSVPRAIQFSVRHVLINVKGMFIPNWPFDRGIFTSLCYIFFSEMESETI